MAWVRVDDSFPDHAKALKAREAIALWLEGLCYANRHLTDGVLPTHVVAAMRLTRNPIKAAGVLVEAGLWEVCEGGWRIHDYHDHYLTAAEVREKRREDSKRKRHYIPKASVGIPSGIQPESQRIPSPRAGTPAGWDGKGLDLPAGLEGRGEEGAAALWSADDLWTLWLHHGEAHQCPQPLTAGPKVYEHLKRLMESYTEAQLRAALTAWWDSPHTGGRNLGLFLAQVGEVLEHLSKSPGAVFRAPAAKSVGPSFSPEAWAADRAAKRAMR